MGDDEEDYSMKEKYFGEKIIILGVGKFLLYSLIIKVEAYALYSVWPNSLICYLFELNTDKMKQAICLDLFLNN